MVVRQYSKVGDRLILVEYLTPQLTYKLSEGVHHYQFYDGNRANIDAILIHYESVRKAHPPDQPLRLLIDLASASAPSLSYMMTQVRNSYRVVPPVPVTLIAYIIVDNHITRLGRSMLELLRFNVKRRFFLKNELEPAYAWLLNR